ncbi:MULTISPECIES: hypothetical protein [unclassified Pseudomonas]|uniref:hypothetical protein n=1 Tax=unclassified Pseudomonas TaxID=196821 RepID=UPI000C884792|nr:MULTISPECIES: hypothetical protein [unclassified Pseudomonas]PNA02881.1 hypothetical protein C1X79_00490 [Pseudomonas sp. FW305-42]PNA27611.1 hypothetical protein C1X78_02235 [Pseudomonas sp. MPR-R1B]PNB29671.1 hypothetical protein C1X80_00930 [Pseudomonas sp. DP16D-E2]PNB45227.1 hypothetical protein C1X75_02845 [Pseudomonas sp. FW305-17]PNB63596.1 hypothetical protein C1X77_06220 [Pseudomonas sp. GW531-E2]
MGLEVFAEGNHIQLTGNNPVLSLVHKRTVALVAGFDPFNRTLMAGADVTLPAHGVLLLGDTQGQYISVEYGLGHKDVVRFACFNPTVITIYVFAKAPIMPSKWGLQSYSATGELLYDSSHKTLRIAYAGPVTKAGLDFPVVPGNTYAAGLAYYRRYYLVPPFHTTTFVQRDMIRVDHGRVSLGRRLAVIEDSNWSDEMFLEPNASMPDPEPGPMAPLIIASVSGY